MYFHATCMYVYVTCTLILFHVSYHMYMYFHATYVYVTCTEYWETVEGGNFRGHVKKKHKISQRKLHWITALVLVCLMNAAQYFVEKTFTDSHQTTKIANNFSLENCIACNILYCSLYD